MLGYLDIHLMTVFRLRWTPSTIALSFLACHLAMIGLSWHRTSSDCSLYPFLTSCFGERLPNSGRLASSAGPASYVLVCRAGCSSGVLNPLHQMRGVSGCQATLYADRKLAGQMTAHRREGKRG
jgi:hypothetical protein